MDSFEKSLEYLEWTTDTKLFEKFPRHLAYYHNDVCMEIIDGVTKTVAHLNVIIYEFKETVFQVHNYEEQMYYIR